MNYLKGLGIAILLTSANMVTAVPVLQLGIGGGEYDTATQTIVTSANTFTLYAYAHATGNKAIDLTETHYISVALVDNESGKVGPDAPSGGIGSFDFTGASCISGSTCTIDDMAYGTPPVEADGSVNTDPKDLSSHGIFETFFLEVGFLFSGQRTALVNTQDSPGSIPVVDSSGDLYFQAFNIDASLLRGGFGLHFDLYNSDVKLNGITDDTDVDKFAPFSHDAAFVPEPNSLALFSLGFIILGFVTFRKKQQL